MYDLPEFNYKNFKKTVISFLQNETVRIVFLLLIIGGAVAVATGKVTPEQISNQFNQFSRGFKQELIAPTLQSAPQKSEYVSRLDYEQAIINSVKSASPSVVSIVISKNLPVYEQQYVNPFAGIPGFDDPFGNILIPQNVQQGTKLQEVGEGSGFIISPDGMILTNKHVVSDPKATYAVITSDGTKYTAKVLALDPVQDLAVVKINTDVKLPSITLGDSNGIEIGQGAIAIGNALGQFSNTVSVGVVSGLGRTVNASDNSGSFSETLEGIIQTDAAINPGNSGGPLLNLKGEVIGINVATATNAQSIGFAIPVNVAKRDINQVIKTNKIIYPFLGVRHMIITDSIKDKYNLPVNHGALIIKGENGEAAITKDSPADKAGLKEGDIILEVNGEAISTNDSLAKIIQKYNPGDKVTLKVLRDGKEMMVDVTLTERS